VDFDTEVSSIDLTEEFENTVQSDWLRKHAHEVGFILRYPSGKETITGYGYERWHYRYIGREEAAKMHAAGESVTMEEFYGIPGGDYEER
jgi:LAS superfamily LD-carboxypeptidase LdcB